MAFSMHNIHTEKIIKVVRRLCIEANLVLPDDVKQALITASVKEKSPIGRNVINDLLLNLVAADELKVPICQDTGMAVVFLEVGQEVHITGGSLSSAVNEGVRQGYIYGRLRCSVVADPLERINTNDNTPAIIHTQIVEGEELRITVAPKGFGSENMSAIKMFTPSAGREDIIAFVVQTVSKAGSMPCPPVIVGVGIGGDFEYAAILAKKALCRPLDERGSNNFYINMEDDILKAVNSLGIGPQGFGGTVTALAINIETFATHIAGLPVAVNMGCHVTRHKTAII
jgi:fumarate hydratase subunit alpha